MRRFRALEDLQKVVVGEINQQFLGQSQSVLFESKQRGENGVGAHPPTASFSLKATKTSLVKAVM